MDKHACYISDIGWSRIAAARFHPVSVRLTAPLQYPRPGKRLDGACGLHQDGAQPLAGPWFKLDAKRPEPIPACIAGQEVESTVSIPFPPYISAGLYSLI